MASMINGSITARVPDDLVGLPDWKTPIRIAVLENELESRVEGKCTAA